MTRKYAFILLLLVAVPMLALAALSWRLVSAEQARIQKQFEELLSGSLVEIDRDIADYFDSLEDHFLDASFDPMDANATRSFVRSAPLVDQLVMLDQEGQILFPDFKTLSEQEGKYLEKVSQLLIDKTFVSQDGRSSNDTQKMQQAMQQTRMQVQMQPNAAPTQVRISRSEPVDPKQSANIDSQEYGWYTWWDVNGIQLIHWQRLPDGITVLVGVQRARWMADVISELPDSDESQTETAPS